MRRRRPGVLKPTLQLAAAIALGLAARDERVAAKDEAARATVYRARTEGLDRAMPVVTDLGSTYAVFGVAAALLAAGRRHLARDVMVAGLGAWTLAQAAKPLFRRPRPYDVAAVEITVRRPAGMSYPSGHPAVAAAVDRVLQPHLRGPAHGWFARIPKLVALSRVYVGVHYPSDVAGGLLMGRALGNLWLRYTAADRR